MSFSDEDLKQLKEYCEKNSKNIDFFGMSMKSTKALIARLEVAENYCRAIERHEGTVECVHPKCGHNFTCQECLDEMAAAKAWRKEKGEEKL